MKRYAYIPLVTVLASCAVFKGGNKKSKKSAAATPAAATPAKPVAPVGKNGIKPYDQVITKNMITQRGLITVHNTREMDSVFLEIDKPLLGRDILVVNRIKKAPGGILAYPGEELDNSTIFFEKGPNESIRVRLNLVIGAADSSNAIARAVTASNLNPVIANFPIKAYGKDSASYVIDVSKFLKENNNFINSGAPNHPFIAKSLDVKNMKDHEVNAILAFPDNIEISISKNGMISGPAPRPATLETTTSLIALPEKPMQMRYFDQRVGYFSDWMVKYADDQQGSKERHFIHRWRLEPKPEDMERYKRGELVEPAKPIVLYIDPATPKKWRKYLIMGVNDWQVAFEQAGFKNAIVAKEWPENDTTMRIEDVRYSFINYFASELTNAYGPNVHDPRSGEIIQTHIGWYHNVMELLHNWYQVQAGPNDPKARSAEFDDELMGQLIRFVSSHEVGHTLGLRHNFGSSSRTPVDSLRNIAYLKAHGHTASIMDYARFNYVAQPEDKIPQELLFPRIGEYDRWAIEWGYKYINAKTPEEDNKVMRDLITKRLAANDRLWFGDGEEKKIDPACQTEDLGDNAAKANALGIKNLKRVMANLKDWTKEDGGQRELLKNMYEQVMKQYNQYLIHVAKNIAAVNYTVRMDGDDRPSYTVVPKAKQIDAVEFFNNEVFKTPTWLMDTKIRDMVEVPGGIHPVETIQISAVNSLLSPVRINYLMTLERRYGNKALGIEQYMQLVRKEIWNNLSKVDGNHQMMQNAYVGALFNITRNAKAEISESLASSVAFNEIKTIGALIKKALPQAADQSTRAHLNALNEKIDLLSKNL